MTHDPSINLGRLRSTTMLRGFTVSTSDLRLRRDGKGDVVLPGYLKSDKFLPSSSPFAVGAKLMDPLFHWLVCTGTPVSVRHPTVRHRQTK